MADIFDTLTPKKPASAGSGDVFDQLSPDKNVMITSSPNAGQSYIRGRGQPPVKYEDMSPEDRAEADAVSARGPINLDVAKPLEDTPPAGGLIGLGKGIYSMITGRSQEGQPVSKPAAGSQMLRGALDAASPLGMEFAAANPMRAALGVGIGAGTGAGVQAGASNLGFSPDTSQLAGDVAGTVAGGAAAMPWDRISAAFMRKPDVVSDFGSDTPQPVTGSDLGIRLLGLKVPGVKVATGLSKAAKSLNLAARLSAATKAAMPQGPPPDRTPIWDTEYPSSQNEDLSNVPVQGPMPQPQLPSGRVPGQPAPAQPNQRVPLWQGVTAPAPITPASFAPTPGQLPSGRVPGGISQSNMITPAPDMAWRVGGPPKVLPENLGKPGSNAFLNKNTTGVQNEFEISNRVQKAMKLARFLYADGKGITSDDVNAMEPEHWSMAARGANTSMPSQATKNMAIEMLKMAENYNISPGNIPERSQP
jgi:hypothetical protein